MLTSELALNSKEININFHPNDYFDNKTIIINARGIKYEILSRTLDKFPNTRLGKLKKHINNNNLHDIGLLCDRYNTELTEFYFNRDPYVLNMILNYYQTHKLHINHSECVLFLQAELDYWQIDEDSFHSCCQVVYHDKLDNAEDLIQFEKKVFKKFNHRDDYGKYCFPRIREILWNLFEKPESSIYAKIVFYFSSLVILISNLELSNKLF